MIGLQVIAIMTYFQYDIVCAQWNSKLYVYTYTKLSCYWFHHVKLVVWNTMLTWSRCVLVVTLMLRALKKQSHEQLELRRPDLINCLENFGDFYLELKWDFHSWRMCTCCHQGFHDCIIFLWEVSAIKNAKIFSGYIALLHTLQFGPICRFALDESVCFWKNWLFDLSASFSNVW